MTFAQFLEQRGVAVRIAQQLGVAHSTVWRWGQSRVPVTRLPELSRVTGIPARDLRPDLAHLLKAQKGRRRG